MGTQGIFKELHPEIQSRLMMGQFVLNYSLAALIPISGYLFNSIVSNYDVLYAGILCILTLFTGLFYKKSNDSDFTSFVLLNLVFISSCYLQYSVGGIFSPSMLWMVFLPIVAGMFSRIYAAYFGVLCLGWFSMLLSGTILNWNYGLLFNTNSHPVFFLTFAIFNIIVAFAFHIYFEYQIQKTIEDRSNFLIEINEMNQDLIFKDQQLQSKLAENTNLIRLLSHDVSNPLQVIISSLNMWDKTKDDAKPRSIQRMKISANHILELLDTVKKLQAINSGKFNPELEVIDFTSLLHEINNLFETKILEKELRFEIYNHSQQEFTGDNSLLKNIIGNLVSNAIKFSKNHDRIWISAYDKENWTYIEVQDQGIGIPEELLEKLFRLDAKTSRPGTAGEKGTGFGMPLVQAYIRSMGGDVEVESRDIDSHPNNHGTCIRLKLRKHDPTSVRQAA